MSPDAPVPELNKLGLEERRPGCPLLVDVYHSSDVVGDKLNMTGLYEWKKGLAGKTDYPEF